jgi:hypothetical protein
LPFFEVLVLVMKVNIERGWGKFIFPVLKQGSNLNMEGKGEEIKKNRHRLVKADGGLNKNPASSYSPTQLPVQYHWR